MHFTEVINNLNNSVHIFRHQKNNILKFYQMCINENGGRYENILYYICYESEIVVIIILYYIFVLVHIFHHKFVFFSTNMYFDFSINIICTLKRR